MFETVRYTKLGPVATIEIHRPEVINAYNIKMRDELFQVLEATRDDPEVHGVILHGAGSRGFCSGADLTEFGTTPSQTIARQVRWQRDLWGLLANHPKTIVAAIHGYCLGIGIEIACLCDFRIASTDLVAGLPEVLLGMIPAAGGTQSLARVVGQGRALELLLTGCRIDANRALDLGLVTKVVAPSHLLQEAKRLLEEILQQPPELLEMNKTMINRGLEISLEHALRMEYRHASIWASNRSERWTVSK